MVLNCTLTSLTSNMSYWRAAVGTLASNFLTFLRIKSNGYGSINIV